MKVTNKTRRKSTEIIDSPVSETSMSGSGDLQFMSLDITPGSLGTDSRPKRGTAHWTYVELTWDEIQQAILRVPAMRAASRLRSGEKQLGNLYEALSTIRLAITPLAEEVTNDATTRP